MSCRRGVEWATGAKKPRAVPVETQKGPPCCRHMSGSRQDNYTNPDLLALPTALTPMPAAAPAPAPVALNGLEVVHNGNAQARQRVGDGQSHHVQGQGAKQRLGAAAMPHSVVGSVCSDSWWELNRHIIGMCGQGAFRGVGAVDHPLPLRCSKSNRRGPAQGSTQHSTALNSPTACPLTRTPAQ